MAITLTDLIPDFYAALNLVSRELVGMVPSATINAAPERAALNQAIKIPIAEKASDSIDVVPSMTPPTPATTSFSNTELKITKSKAQRFSFTGDEQKEMMSGIGLISGRANIIAEKIRALVNEVEADLTSLYSTCSRAYGTAGTTAFSSGIGDTAQLRKILNDNGAPTFDRQLVLDTTNEAAMLSNTQLTKANEAGSTDPMRRGVLLDVHGFAIRASGQSELHTKGTGTGYVVNGTFSAGDTTITLDTGTGTVLAGDVVTFAGSAYKYVVKTGTTAAGDIVIAAPGLVEDIADDAVMTITSDYSASMAFHRNAIQLVMRAPSLPEEGDLAVDRQIIVDPNSGIPFELSVYKGYKMVAYEIGLAWGYGNIKPEHSALLIS
ncbi:MAG: P22 phage major capsid protein family protein [Rickettsiales bacterium]